MLNSYPISEFLRVSYRIVPMLFWRFSHIFRCRLQYVKCFIACLLIGCSIFALAEENDVELGVKLRMAESNLVAELKKLREKKLILEETNQVN